MVLIFPIGLGGGFHAQTSLKKPRRASYQQEGQAIEKDKQAESLYPAFCQRTCKMGAHWKTERSEPIYK